MFSACCTYSYFLLSHSGSKCQVAKGVAGVSAASRRRGPHYQTERKGVQEKVGA